MTKPCIYKNNDLKQNTLTQYFQFFVSGPTINPHSSRLNNFKSLVALVKPWWICSCCTPPTPDMNSVLPNRS